MADDIDVRGVARAIGTGTIQRGWQWLRCNLETGSADTDPMATVTNFDFGDKSAAPSSGGPQAPADFVSLVAVQVPKDADACEVIFFGDDGANETSTYLLYAYAAGGPPKLVTSGTIILGTARCQTEPVSGLVYEGTASEMPGTVAATAFYVDTIGNSDQWNGAVVSDSGADRVAVLAFDLRGYQWLTMVFNSLGTAAGMSAAYRVF